MSSEFSTGKGDLMDFWSKSWIQNLELLLKNRNFGQKWKLWPKIKILVKNGNFGQKWKLWSRIKILFKK